MGQLKSHEAEAWLSRPDPRIRMALVYGPDRGLVTERATTLAAAVGAVLDDPFSVLKLDASEIAGDSGRLLDELRAIPMFGGMRLVWLRDASASRDLAAIVGRLVGDPPPEAFLLVEAGELRKGSPLRTVFEDAPCAMAVPCYADDGRALDRVIDDALSEAGMTMTLDARQSFKALLGGDRLATRGEIEKLLLYCHGRPEIDMDDVAASAGDVSALPVDSIADAVLGGRRSDFDRAFSRAIAVGAHPFAVLSAMMRQFQQLQVLRHRLEQGRETAASLVASARPPIFFARRALFTEALSSWNGSGIADALRRIQKAVLDTRGGGGLAVAIAHRALLSICVESAKRNRKPGRR